MTYKQKIKNNIRLYYWQTFFSSLIFVVPIWVAYERQYLSFSQMASLEAIAAGVTMILELPTGALADLLGRKKTIFIGKILRGAGNIYMAFAVSFPMFLLVFIASGISQALVSGADTALLFDSLKEVGKEKDFSKVNARLGILFRFGLITTTFIGGYIYKIWMGLPFVLLGVFEIISGIVTLFMEEPRIDSEVFTLKNYIKQTKIGFAELFKSSYVKKLTTFYAFVGGITWSCLYYFNQPFALDVGFSDMERSWLFGGIFLLVAIAIYFLAESKRFLTRNKVYIGLPLIMMLGLLPGIFATKSTAPFMLFFVVLAGASRFAILDRFTNQEFRSKYRATAISSLNMIVSLLFIIIVWVGGIIQDAHSTKIIYTILGFLTIFLALPSGIRLVTEYKNYQKRKATLS